MNPILKTLLGLIIAIPLAIVLLAGWWIIIPAFFAIMGIKSLLIKE